MLRFVYWKLKWCDVSILVFLEYVRMNISVNFYYNFVLCFLVVVCDLKFMKFVISVGLMYIIYVWYIVSNFVSMNFFLKDKNSDV